MSEGRTRAKLRKLLTDPLGVVRRRAQLAWLLLRYGGMDERRSEQFWNDRHARYGADDLRGVGMESWSQEQNQRDYEAAGRLVLERAAQVVALDSAQVLDIGCGTGFYAGLLRERGVAGYTGVDLASTLLPTLRERFPGYRFEQLDITLAPPPAGPYDLIVMIDVTQHLVREGAFPAAMGHVRDSLAPGGVLLVTSWLRGPERLSFYEQARPRSAYEAEFPAPEFRIEAAVPFRRKHLLTIRRRAEDSSSAG